MSCNSAQVIRFIAEDQSSSKSKNINSKKMHILVLAHLTRFHCFKARIGALLAGLFTQMCFVLFSILTLKSRVGAIFIIKNLNKNYILTLLPGYDQGGYGGDTGGGYLNSPSAGFGSSQGPTQQNQKVEKYCI